MIYRRLKITLTILYKLLSIWHGKKLIESERKQILQPKTATVTITKIIENNKKKW